MKAYQYEIESRLIKMLMCLCVVLSFAGCNSDEAIRMPGEKSLTV